MKRRLPAIILVVSFILSLFFLSCSHGNRNSGDTTVTFSMNRQTVNTILENSKSNLAAKKSYRAADDIDQEAAETTGLQEASDSVTPSDSENETDLEEEEEEEPEDNTEVENAPYDSIFIDVSLLGDYEYPKTALVKEDQAIQLKFRAVPIGAVVYAQAQIYTYKDETKTTKIILYRGNSSSIIVRDRGNKLSIALDKATLTVTFDSNGGTAVESMKVLTGQIISKPENPTNYNSKSKTISAFMGWYVDPDFTKPYDFESPVTQDITLYAKWLADYVLIPAGKVSGYLSGSRNPLDISELYVCQHEVTQKEYYEITGEKPSLRAIAGDNFPVENVSWYEAIVYCNLRSIKEGLSPCYKIYDSLDPKDWGTVPQTNNQDWNGVLVNLKANGYRLLTEAEWEYVARLGIDNTSKEYSKLVLDSQNSNGKTWEVNNRLADDIGICNILGNVSEWCYDWYSGVVSSTAPLDGPTSGTTRVYRGGDFTGGQTECSVDYRASNAPYYKSGSVGFRVARALTDVDWSSISSVHTITYKIEGCDEEKLVPVEFNYTDAVVLPYHLDREGYLFAGWYTTEDFAEGSRISGWDSKQKSYDVTVYGKWTPITYTIRFNKGKSSSTAEMPAQTFTYDKPQELSECIFEAPAGLKFGGWIALDTTGHDDDELERDYSDKQEVLNITSENGAVITLYALWVNKNRSNIIYMIDGLEVTGLTPSSFLPSQSVMLPTATTDAAKLTKEGYTFSGWYTTSDFKSDNLITGWASGIMESDITVYGKFESVGYTITYQSAGSDWDWVSGFTEYPKSYTTEDKVTLPPAEKLSKAYYEFAGWYFDSEFTKPASEGWNAGKTGDVTLYAKWTPEVYEIKYQLNGNDGEEIQNPNTKTTYDVATTGPITLASAVRPGYTFEGWYNENSEKVTSITPGTGSNQDHKDIILKANWTPNTYTVTFYPGKSTDTMTMDAQTLTYDVETTLRECQYQAPSGLKFGGWVTYDTSAYTSDDDLTPEYSNKQSVKNLTTVNGAEIKLYAIWINKSRCDIIYMIDGEEVTGLSPASFLPSQGVTLPTADTDATHLTRTGYTFSGWFEDPGYNSATAITGWAAGSKEDTVKVYGKFEPVSYTITYVGEGDVWNWKSGFTAKKSFTIEEAVNELPYAANVNRDNYDFVGWYFDSELTQSALGGWAEGRTTPVTLYAKWSLHEYVIEFNLNDELYNDPVYGEKKSNVFANNSANTITRFTIESDPITLKDPTQPGYTFKGWYSDSDCTNTITTITPGTGSTQAHTNVPVYAKWEIKEFNIYYYADGSSGGMTPSPDKFTVESDTITLLTPETYPSWQKEGKTFVGWYASDTLTGDSISSITPDPDSGMYCDNVKVYGKWEFIHYTINYNTNGGGTMEPTDYTKQNGTLTLEDPAWTGHHFNGWYTSSDFSGDAVATLTFTTINALANSENEITLYAKWSSAGVTVTVENPKDGDLEVQDSTSGNTLTLEIKNYDSNKTYTWYVDGDEITSTTRGFTISGNILQINISTETTTRELADGTYVITLVQGAYNASAVVKIGS